MVRSNVARTSLVVVLCAAGASLMFFVPRAVRASAAGTAELVATSAAAGGDLEEHMENLNRAYRRLKSQVADKSANESSLELIVEMQRSTLAAKSTLPPRVLKMPTEQRAKAEVEYRTMMIGLLNEELEVEQALLAGDNAKAAEAFAEITELQTKGHKEFRGKRAAGGDESHEKGHEKGHEKAPATRPAH